LFKIKTNAIAWLSRTASVSLLVLATSASLGVTVNQTHSATSGITFGGTVPDNGGGDPGGGDNGCQIELTRNSILTISSDFLELSSKQSGGLAGQVRVTKTGTDNLALSVDAPGSFTTNPLGGDTGVTITTTYLTTGATSTPEVAGNVSTPLADGITLMDVNLIATRVGSPFPSGDYETTATVRCE